MQKQQPEQIASPDIKTVLVPLDGSALAESVLPYVKEICRAFKATAYLISIADPGLDDAIAARPDTTQLIKQMETHADSYLKKMSSDLGSNGITVQTIVKAGNAGEVVVNAANEINASLIAMSTHGRSGVSRMVYGSVADRVLHDARNTPIFLVRPPEDRSLPFNRLQNIVIPLDGSRLGEEALPYAVALAQKMNLTMHLVQVVNTTKLSAWGDSSYAGTIGGVPSGDLITSLEEAAKEYIAGVAARLESAKLKVVQKVIIGSPTWQIVSYADKLENSFVTMTTHGRTGLRRTLIGSVADGILRESGDPVLMIPSKR